MTNPSLAAPHKSRYESLLQTLAANDTLGIAIVADPDAIASALALKRLVWRKVKKTLLCRVNRIQRSDNLALIRCLRIVLPHISKIDTSAVSAWALVDSQPHHHPFLENIPCRLVIDHHAPEPDLQVPFIDIREEYGANSSIMTEYLRASGIRPSAKLATALFYGIKTDTDNFSRTSCAADINAFCYLYPYVNLNIIKQIESSEINKKNIADFRKAFDSLHFIGDTVYVHMGEIKNPDSLVILADFFLKMAEATWCMISGIYGQKIIIIIRNAAPHLDAGAVAARLFSGEGSAGGHKNTARAEIPLAAFKEKVGDLSKIEDYLRKKIKSR
jgi:nanoRNase/pAp phosphatase (c-di-AMP/oligoRNAs hydrolase)